MNEEIKLLKTEFNKDSEGYNALTVISSRVIFAECRDPYRKQRELANRQGYQASKTFKVYTDEYHNEGFIEYGGKRYEVKESYRLDAQYTELTCSDSRY